MAGSENPRDVSAVMVLMRTRVSHGVRAEARVVEAAGEGRQPKSNRDARLTGDPAQRKQWALENPEPGRGETSS